MHDTDDRIGNDLQKPTLSEGVSLFTPTKKIEEKDWTVHPTVNIQGKEMDEEKGGQVDGKENMEHVYNNTTTDGDDISTRKEEETIQKRNELERENIQTTEPPKSGMIKIKRIVHDVGKNFRNKNKKSP